MESLGFIVSEYRESEFDAKMIVCIDSKENLDSLEKYLSENLESLFLVQIFEVIDGKIESNCSMYRLGNFVIYYMNENDYRVDMYDTKKTVYEATHLSIAMKFAREYSV